MAEESSSTERSRNLWAPWRMEYINGLSEKEGAGCFLCRYRDETARDRENLVLWRTRRCLAVLNRFPYTGGHALVAPLEHVGELAAIGEGTLLEMMTLLRDLQIALTEVVRAHGFNIGLNIGRCAGAGLPGHLHAHIVPRWSGDTNFMAVMGGVRVIPNSLDDLYEAVRSVSAKLKLPNLPEGGR